MNSTNHKHAISKPKEIRATYNESTIRVYQAYSEEIADNALIHGNFTSPPFKKNRMTWIKPSFLWMMYRSNWATKDTNQSRILAIDITHEGFEWALKNSCPSHPDESLTNEQWNRKKNEMPVRIQWDPERDFLLNPLPYRTIQIGLSKKAVDLYIKKWIKLITDITPLVHKIHYLIKQENFKEAIKNIPVEYPYKLK